MRGSPVGPLPIRGAPLAVALGLALGPAVAPAAPATAAIPAGTAPTGNGRASDQPRRDLGHAAFQIDLHEVTIAQFEAFAARAWSEPAWWSAAGWSWAQAHPGGAGPTLRAAGRAPDHPVVGVSWFEADAYCRAAGGALPTELQWERSCTGGSAQIYPWGDGEDRDARWYAEGKFGHIQDVKTAAAADQDPALRSREGLTHLSGNVWEWTADAYAPTGLAAEGGAPGGAASPWRVMRGGSYMNLPSYCTCSHREPARPDRVALTVGFRCAYPAR
jgi:iron(II)-dependent oxidoreductase